MTIEPVSRSPIGVVGITVRLAMALWLALVGSFGAVLQYGDADIGVPPTVNLAKLAATYVIGGLVFGAAVPRRWSLAVFGAWASAALWIVFSLMGILKPFPGLTIATHAETIIRSGATMAAMPIALAALGGFLGSRLARGLAARRF